MVSHSHPHPFFLHGGHLQEASFTIFANEHPPNISVLSKPKGMLSVVSLNALLKQDPIARCLDVRGLLANIYCFTMQNSALMASCMSQIHQVQALFSPASPTVVMSQVPSVIHPTKHVANKIFPRCLQSSPSITKFAWKKWYLNGDIFLRHK